MNDAAEILKLSNYITTDRVLSLYSLQFTVHSIIWLGTQSSRIKEIHKVSVIILVFIIYLPVMTR